ncbi:MAG: methyltransferase domain-containing protein [Candidatus Omnitrophota bacterium]|nr:methyltransferase domain-containing protein [Candidatus Omnitrophota bacterium]
MDLHAEKTTGDQTTDGCIACRTCGAEYPIRDGIPRMSPSHETRTEHRTRHGFNYQLARQITSHGGHDDESGYKIPAAFFQATEMDEGEARLYFRDKVFLDVGCGLGQYSSAALNLGATVISLDINDSGLAAYARHHVANDRQHVVQASALHLPLRDECVDYSWSMGVLHHTDDLRLGFREMARVLRRGGVHNVGIYYKYKHWTYYERMRKVTTRLPYFLLNPICNILAILSYVPFMSFLCHPWVNRTESFHSRAIGAFDHFHPPVQGYYTPAEVRAWYHALGCFGDIHMTQPFNNFVAVKTASLPAAEPRADSASTLVSSN